MRITKLQTLLPKILALYGDLEIFVKIVEPRREVLDDLEGWDVERIDDNRVLTLSNLKEIPREIPVGLEE